MRFLKWGGLAVLFFSVLTLAGLWLWGGRPLPVAEWERIGSLRLKLHSSQADLLLPEQTARVGVRFDALKRDYYSLSAELPWFRDPGPLVAELSAYAAEIESLLAAADRRREELLEEQSMEIDALEGLLEPGLARILIPEYRIHRSRFQMRLAEAKVVLGDRDPFRAAEIIEELKGSSTAVRFYLEELEARFDDPALLAEWGRLCERARRMSRTGGRVLLIDKYHRRTHVLEKGRIVRSFVSELGWNGMRDKLQQGDGATPEGEYKVTRKKAGRNTIYYKALLINYPNDQDRVRFRQAIREGQVTAGARIGGLIEIHGDGGQGRDWTDGCVALENSDMDELYALAYVGMPVVVVGRCPSTN